MRNALIMPGSNSNFQLAISILDERTCSKFFFYAGNDYQEPGGLPDYIPDEYLPDFLGGTCTVRTHC